MTMNYRLGSPADLSFGSLVSFFHQNFRHSRMMRFSAIVIIAASCLAAPAFAWEEVSGLRFEDKGEARDLLVALDRQRAYINAMSGGATLRIGGARISKEQLLSGIHKMTGIVLNHYDKADFSDQVNAAFRVYRTSSPKKARKAHFTAYFDPVLEASTVRTDRFRFPIYKRPADLIESGGKAYRKSGGKKILYYTRAKIEGGALTGRGLEAAWVDDYVELHFLHIQGSGYLRFADGSMATLHVSGTNGYGFKSAVRMIQRKGLCSGAYMESKLYLKNHPDIAAAYLPQNPRYIFFKTSDEPPSGIGGIPLTPGRTIATDKPRYPVGAIAYIRYNAPVVDENGKVMLTKSTSRFVVDSDTGNAIRGAGRADLYMGTGPKAELLAGAVNTYGEMYYLIPR